MEIMFELKHTGKLTLEHTFYMYEEPILFVCKDDSGLRYLCSCCRLSEKWVVTQVNATELMLLITDKITIRELFESHAQSMFLVTWDGENYERDTDVPSELLPKKGAKLELDYEKDGAYYNTLKHHYEK